MPAPPTRSGGPDHQSEAPAKTAALTKGQHQQDSRQDRHRQVLVAVGQYHPPAGRRHLGVVIVAHCPGCGHLHIHRAMTVTTADGSSRTGSCGIEYRLRVLPAQRIGGAA